MGFFDFLKHKGDGVIKSDDSAAADIKSHIEANNPTMWASERATHSYGEGG